MPEKTNPDESEDMVKLKGIPAAGNISHEDRLQNDDCNRISDIILDAKNIHKITAAIKFDQNAELHTINQALSNELALYRNILSVNITDTLHNIQSYIIRDVFPIAMPTLEKLSPKVFHAQPAPVRDAVFKKYSKPEKPSPKHAEREPQIGDEKYSSSNYIEAIGGVIFLMSPISIFLINNVHAMS